MKTAPPAPTRANKIRGTIYGTALADAWGIDTEFRTRAQNRANPTPLPERLIITDDTQMSLYNHYAYEMMTSENQRPVSPETNIEAIHDSETLRNKVRNIYGHQNIRFYKDPDNNRAPGTTCMTAIRKYQQTPKKVTGREGALDNNSKGCGANMRATWLGLYPRTEQTIITLAILQAQTTHNHPLAWASAAITALTVKDLIDGFKPAGNGGLFLLAAGHIERLFEGWDGFTFWDTRIIEGFEELKEGLRTQYYEKYEPYKALPADTDPNEHFGQGWVAEEALYNAIGVVEKHPHDPMVGLSALVHSNGDSDSTAAIAGAFYGALLGDSWLPENIQDRFEERYNKELSRVVLSLTD